MQLPSHVLQNEAAYLPLALLPLDWNAHGCWVTSFHHADENNTLGAAGATKREGPDPWVTSFDRDADQPECVSATALWPERCKMLLLPQLSLHPKQIQRNPQISLFIGVFSVTAQFLQRWILQSPACCLNFSQARWGSPSAYVHCRQCELQHCFALSALRAFTFLKGSHPSLESGALAFIFLF